MLATLSPEPLAAGTRPFVIVLKGAALATTLYPCIALRPLSDVDLLVPRQHLGTAVAAMQSLGYCEVYLEMSPGLNQVAGHHVLLQGGARRGVAVELHWSLVAGESDWRSPSLDWFWEQTESWNMDGARRVGEVQGNQRTDRSRPVFQLTPTAQLL
ncbi:MAG: nucleotidyltransferase family protein [Ardenticatenaceae bacterium]|nr:nucleotidyltransferase family protein [Ardenticatenaceae bacterium]